MLTEADTSRTYVLKGLYGAGWTDEQIAADGYHLARKNPNAADIAHLPPEQLLEEIVAKERWILELLEEIRRMLAEGAEAPATDATERVPADG